jgi:phytoene desaturase
MPKKIVIIGSGFSSLSAACYLAKEGYEVLLFEKNATVGGRARQMSRDGFIFDMGPSWYWMPDIFERFFADFGKKPSDYYHLYPLDPAYKIFFPNDTVTVPRGIAAICDEFERIEPGSSPALQGFMKHARENYKIAMNNIVYRPGLSPMELISPSTVLKFNQFLKTVKGEVRRRFKNPKLIAILEFPVLFLGAKPADTPAFYSFMNYADFGLGTWHPRGGMYQVVEGMKKLAESLGVRIATDSPVEKIEVIAGTVKGIQYNGQKLGCDIVVSGADYHHSESLLDPEFRQYSDKYWSERVFAPSCLLFYVGFKARLKQVKHHNLFFDTDFEQHASQIYDLPQWPAKPLFYANFPSVTDRSMAPEGCESGFFLIPIAPGLDDTPELRQKYFDHIMERFAHHTGNNALSDILFRESFCIRDFKESYNAYKGNAYGMANTLRQTAFLRPGLKSKKVKNLYFTGQLTVPGPGVPPALISGKLVSDLVIKQINLIDTHHEIDI